WLYGVWGSSSTDVFAVGGDGTILHYDGSDWSGMTSPTSRWFSGVWGSSSTDVFAVGGDGTILHYDGSDWSGMTSGTSDWLYGVWGSSSTDVFAVGDFGTILHYDGGAWSGMTRPTSRWFSGVWGSSASDVFAMGSDGTILHYDGSDWSGMTSGTSDWLEGVWGSSSSDVFAVGSGGTILHYREPANLVVSCDVNGNEKNSFGPGETVYVWGSGFAAGDYNIFIQPDGSVSETGGTLDSTFDPSGGAGAQESVTANSNGDIPVTPIWVIPVDAPPTAEEWDIIVDDGDGEYNAANDGIDDATSVGFVAPVPELPTFVLFGVGLLGLGCYAGLRRMKEHQVSKFS
ncbi:MAG: hypothetical protein SVY53_13060, partial [Chloroflexota bacterium]|nr:hypothetical protein [Chloroflexota bacterium]